LESAHAGQRGEEALGWSDAEWDEKLRASAMRRIKPAMWRRNIHAATGLGLGEGFGAERSQANR
jgi:epoxyqueuosine reductase